MNAKHTPGPWRVERYFSKWLIGNGNGSYLIAETAGSPAYLGRASAERDAANAYLIAAAPNLLETLQVLLSLHDACVDTADAWNASMEEARAAIAKATGDYHSDLRQRTSCRH